MKDYCKCELHWPSIRHDNCMNDGCGKSIKSIYIKCEELEVEIKKLRAINRNLKQQIVHTKINEEKLRKLVFDTPYKSMDYYELLKDIKG